ncbi:SusC/RagA family TonB-linked outer membrane protein [Dysgonomonas hofstadii]|nr:SusC/RagA family TonB-linked outer membrane protein [Dysgonomonas hofstadii]
MDRFSTKSANTSLAQRVMRIMIFLFLVGMGISHASNTYSQSTKLNLDLRNKTIKEVFSEIEKSSEYIFLYNDENLDITRKVSVNIHNQTIDKILDQIFKNTNNTYYISDRQVFISEKKNTSSNTEKIKPEVNKPVQDPRILIKGTVKDRDGDPLIGVTVKPKKRGIASISGNNGDFVVYVDNMDETLVFTYVGMEEYQLKLKTGTTNYNVVMKSVHTELESVVVEAGIIQRNKLGFTGSYSTVTQEELKAVGNMNVLQSLKSLDPAFVITDNNLMGSDPNTMPTVTLRGGSTMSFSTTLNDNTTNPNEPLFILDGFVTNLQTINDLDINRVESITLLKDAGSTAIYGSKGANGVIVVETIKPKSGEVMINYNTDLQLATADLSAYNLMNAAEKLEYEVRAGRYGDLNNYYGTNAAGIQSYNDNLKRVSDGIDTYWLKLPIRTGFTQSHSMTLSGGNKDFLYQIGANYKNTEGVMKDVNRQSFGGNVRLTYRNAEKKFNVSNNLSVMVTNGHSGSWESFSSFAKANPYYRTTNDDGSIPRFLDEISWTTTGPENTVTAANPYYNSLLNTFSDSRTTSLTNNLGMDWFITDRLRWQANLSLQTTRNESESFKDPRHTSYNETDYSLKGSYSNGYGTNWGYSANTSINYAQLINDAHNITFIGRASIDETNRKNTGYTVRGFPEGVEGIPSYAYGYPESSIPSYSNITERGVSALAALNYNYKYRYNVDFNYNLDGASTFGSNKTFQGFWSVGAAWNVHREAFAEKLKDSWLQELKFRSTYGINGNQNVTAVSENVYKYYTGSDIFGMASYLSDFANPDLRWQLRKKFSAGVDLTMFNKRFATTFDIFQSKTDPMVIALAQKPSSGLSSYSLNAGYMDTKGYEFSVSYYFIRNIKDRISLKARVTGMHNVSKYGGFDSRLDELNNAINSQIDDDGNTINIRENVNSLIRFQDGYSPSDLWAVRSLGIDPATGREVYLTKDGVPTLVWNADNRVVVGNSTPDLEGVFNIDFNYKRLSVSMYFRYRIGAEAFNSALYNKVENITTGSLVYNQDKRALYDRWYQPGDIAKFKDVNVSATTTTALTSRFIQKDDRFDGESFKFSWDFSDQNWIKNLALRSLRISFSMNDIFRIRSMKEERGIDSPYQRAFSFGLSAGF